MNADPDISELIFRVGNGGVHQYPEHLGLWRQLAQQVLTLLGLGATLALGHPRGHSRPVTTLARQLLERARRLEVIGIGLEGA